MNKYKYQRLTFFHQQSDWSIKKVKFGDYKISRKVVALVKKLFQQNDLTKEIHNIHNYYLDLKRQPNEFKDEKKDRYYYEHTSAIQKCWDAIYLLGNCQFFISSYYDQPDKTQLVKTNDDYLLETLYLYFEIKRPEFKEDLRLNQKLQQPNYSVQHKIGILSCNLHGLEKLAEKNLITALKQEQKEEQKEEQLINIIKMLKYLYTKSPAEFSCDKDVKEEILSIIKNKYEEIPKLVEKYRDDFDKNVHTPSELRHNIACAIL